MACLTGYVSVYNLATLHSFCGSRSQLVNFMPNKVKARISLISNDHVATRNFGSEYIDDGHAARTQNSIYTTIADSVCKSQAASDC